MFYIEKDNKIVLFDENKETLQNTLKFTPQYAGLEIQETDRPIVDFQFADTDEYKERIIEQRKKDFSEKFIVTSLGNYRLQPKGYANAQQSIDTVNNIVNVFGGLTEQIASMVLFYETPDFSKEEQCTEEWLVEHQYSAQPMTKEEWLKFYIEFTTLYAQNQYK